MNKKMLNHVSLDGDVIIKRGAGGGTGGSGGGEVLEGEYVLLKRNGWYWKFTDEFIQNNTWLNTIAFLPFEFGMQYYDGVCRGGKVYGGYRDIFYYIGYCLGMGDIEQVPKFVISAISESGGCRVIIGEGEPYETVIEADSAYEVICLAYGEMAESEFEAFLLQVGLQRITKEEYESLITE